MKFYFLGTCSGTEPMPDRKHTSFALEAQGRVYWFDAGEGCSYTAHNLGLDLQKVHKIVISHPHMDHVGGLGNLLWNIRKLYKVRKRLPDTLDIDVYIPSLETWEGIMMILRNSEGNFEIPYRHPVHETQEGVLFDDGVVKVTAIHNNHLPPRNGKWVSYSFLIECEGKRIVYSGDVKSYSDFDPLLGDGCDALIVETGHFHIEDTYAYAKDKNIGKLYFTHNGRDFLNEPEASLMKVKRLWGDGAAVCFDDMTEEI